jgi:hypothetical protein
MSSLSKSPASSPVSPRAAVFGGLSLAALALSAGCYGAAPPRPERVAVPELGADANLEVYSHSATTYENVNRESETCPQGHTTGSSSCVKTTYTVKEPVTRTISTATIGGTPIDYAQFQVISNPRYEEDLVTLADHSEACQEANLPRYIGMGLAIAGVVAYSVGASKSNSTVANIGLLGLAGGAGSYTAGYFAFGGNRCVQAAGLYREINYALYNGQTEIRGSVTALEMKTLADQFNQRRNRSAAASE